MRLVTMASRGSSKLWKVTARIPSGETKEFDTTAYDEAGAIRMIRADLPKEWLEARLTAKETEDA
jgi:hypothetical protein